MLLYEIYNNLGYRIDEEEWDGKLDVDTFNNIIEPSTQTMFRDITKDLYGLPNSGKVPQKTLHSSKYLRSLITRDDVLNNGSYSNITDSTGVLDLSGLENTFGYFVSLDIDTDATITPNLIELGVQSVELIDDLELSNRQKHLLIAPFHYNYVCVIRGDDLIVTPSFDYSGFASPTAYLTYLRQPTTPFLDYYVDSNDNYQFMTTGLDYDFDAGGGGDVDVTGTYRTGATSGVISSATVELDFDTIFHDIFIEYILYIIGLRSKDTLIAQAAQIDKKA